MRIGRRARRRVIVYCAGALRGAENAPASWSLMLHSLLSPRAPAFLSGSVGFLLYLEPDMESTSSNRITAIHQCAICEKPFVNSSPPALWEPTAPPTLNSGT